MLKTIHDSIKPVMFKMNESELVELKKWAKTYAGGNMSKFIRTAITSPAFHAELKKKKTG